MSIDNSEKTVFSKPELGGDRTVLRPMPGGRSAARQPETEPVPLAAKSEQAAQVRAPSIPKVASAVEQEALFFRTEKGLNPLVNAASTLISVYEKTRNATSHPDVGGLHKRLINEIKLFESRCNQINIKPEISLSARYIICTALDEAILNTPWGSESAWNQRTLLSIYHNETSGGEKFFLILERMKQSPAENLNILEMMYLLLSLGYEGRYRFVDRGRDSLESIRDELYKLISSIKGDYERELSPNWQGLGRINSSLVEYIPLWVVGSIAAVILFFGYSGFRYWLYQSSEHVNDQLISITEQAPKILNRNN